MTREHLDTFCHYENIANAILASKGLRIWLCLTMEQRISLLGTAVRIRIVWATTNSSGTSCYGEEALAPDLAIYKCGPRVRGHILPLTRAPLARASYTRILYGACAREAAQFR